MDLWRPTFALVASWLGLLALLALTVTLAYQPLGAFNAVVALSIGTIKAAIVAAVFMDLRHRGIADVHIRVGGIVLARDTALAGIDGFPHSNVRRPPVSRSSPQR